MAAVGLTYLFLGLFVFDLVSSLAHVATYGRQIGIPGIVCVAGYAVSLGIVPSLIVPPGRV